MILDIFFSIIVLIFMTDYDIVVFPQSVSRKYNFICEIVLIERTEVNNIFDTLRVILSQFKRHITITCIFHLLRNNIFESTKLTMQKNIQLLNVTSFYYFTSEIFFSDSRTFIICHLR